MRENKAASCLFISYSLSHTVVLAAKSYSGVLPTLLGNASIA